MPAGRGSRQVEVADIGTLTMRRTAPIVSFLPPSMRRCGIGLAGCCLILSTITPAVANENQSGKVGTASAPTAREQGQSVPPLEFGKPIQMELGGGQSHNYELALAAGHYVHVVVDQRGIDVVVLLFGPSGEKLAEVDSPNGTQGPEPLYAVADTSGNYRITVRSTESTAPLGRYEIRIESLRPATPEDRNLVAGVRAYQEASALREQATPQSLQAAIEKYGETLQLVRAAHDRVVEANALYDLGEVYYQVGDRQKAQQAFLEALPLMRAIGDRSGEAFVVNNLGAVSNSYGENLKAIDFYSEALSLHRAAKNRSGEAEALVNLGFTYDLIGEKQKALENDEQALQIFRDLGARRNEAVTLNNIGSVYSTLGETQVALDYYTKSLALRQILHDVVGEGRTLNNIGRIYADLGDRQSALQYYNQVVALRKGVTDPSGEAGTLSNIAQVYAASGEFEKAIEFFNRSLILSRTTSDHLTEAQTRTNLGAAFWAMGNRVKALEFYEEALPLLKAMHEPQGEARTLLRLGNCYIDSDPRKGLDYFETAAEIFRSIHDPVGESAALYGMARARSRQGNLNEARTEIEASLRMIDTLRIRLTNQELRTLYAASVQSYYRLYIDVLMQLNRQQPSSGFDSLALHASERARARSLLDLLAEAQISIREGVDSALLEKEKSVRQRLNAKAEYQFRLLQGTHTIAQAETVSHEVDSLAREYQDVLAEIRTRNPRYAALTQPQPLTAEQIRREIVGPSTVLLEYSLGDERSYLWAVTSSEVESFELPKRDEIESLARSVYELLTARNRKISGETRQQKRARITQADAEVYRSAARLSQMLLGPVSADLGHKRLLIVSDGSLEWIPFGALPVPQAQLSGVRYQVSGSKKGNGRNSSDSRDLGPGIRRLIRGTRPLIADHEIVYAPSASAVALLRRQPDSRRQAAKTVVVFADPVFSEDDERVKAVATDHRPPATAEGQPLPNHPPLSTPLTRAIDDLEESGLGPKIRRLFHTRIEAGEIAKLVPAVKRKAFLDFEANRDNALGPTLGQYRIVHFASHSLINNVHPELSGVVLSLVDRAGRPEDGFLRANDIFNLNLSADLVVLSACRTALGREIRGEGLVNLTRAFMYAGTPRVVASLWSLDDKVSAEFMVRFYKAMLGRQRKSAAAALRAAALQMWRDQRWKSPYYRAGFLLTGEWK